MYNQLESSSGYTLIEIVIIMLMLAFAVDLVNLVGFQIIRFINNHCPYKPRQVMQLDYDGAHRIYTNVMEVTSNIIIPSGAINIRKNKHGKKVNSYGFTLMELMITVAVVGIVASLGVPSFQNMLNENRVTSLANELAASLNIARSEAIKRGTRVSVCKSANVSSTSPTCSTTANWQNGWLIFVDSGTKGTFDGSDIRLKVGQPSNSSAVITFNNNSDNYISYLPLGNSSSNGTLSICVGGIQRSIIIISSGRIRLTKGTC